MSIKSIILKAAQDVENVLLTVDGKVTKGTPVLIKDITLLVNTIQVYAAKVATDIPLLTDALDSPLGQEIVSLLPNGAAEKAAVIAIINEFLPGIQKAANATITNALNRELSAEILKIENIVITDIGIALKDITYFEHDVEAA